MNITLNEYYNMCYENYYMIFDNKGNFVEGKGICPYKVIKDTEKELKKHITKRRKNNIRAEVVWNKKEHRIANIYIRKGSVVN